MAVKTKPPVVLGEEWLKRIKQSERHLLSLVPLCDQCEECGIDCKDYRNAITALLSNFETFRRVFFGGK